jgi:hypothetical protein
MAFKFNTDFINLGPLTSTNFGIEPIDVSNVGPVAPYRTRSFASASRAASHRLFGTSQTVISTAIKLWTTADQIQRLFFSLSMDFGGDILADLICVADNNPCNDIRI